MWYIILILITLIIFVISKFKKESDVKENSNNKVVKKTVSIPDPEICDDYKFLKYVENEFDFRLDPIYKEIKRKGITLKPQFESAIRQKLETGIFTNPLDFKDTYGVNFDYIGISFSLGTTSLLSAYELKICFIKGNKILDEDCYVFRPPKNILKTKEFQNSCNVCDYDAEFIYQSTFEEIWISDNLREFINNNRIVFWNKDEVILLELLKYNNVNDYNLKYIDLKEIAKQNNLPQNIENLITYYNREQVLSGNLATNIAIIANDMQENGINLEEYEYLITSNNNSITNYNLENMNFVAIDVETAIDKRWSICQIGIAIVEKGKIIHSFSELVQPPNNEYAANNIRIHHITPEITKNKPRFPEIWKNILPIIKNQKLIAHNASFDSSCLKQTLEYYNLEIPELEFDCTFKRTGQKLSDACEAYNISLSNHHDAECDAVACANLYLKIHADIKNVTIPPSSHKTKKVFSVGNLDDKLRGNVLQKDLTNADKSNPFYNKKVVFTGVLENISRNEAAQKIQRMGADINTTISKKTNIVILGKDPGPSKMNKITKNNNEGSSIQIIYEQEFLKMINI